MRPQLLRDEAPNLGPQLLVLLAERRQRPPRRGLWNAHVGQHAHVIRLSQKCLFEARAHVRIERVRTRKLIASIDRKLDRMEARLARIDNRVERIHDREVLGHCRVQPATQRLLDRLDGVSSRRDA
jgi:hypothetical protein